MSPEEAIETYQGLVKPLAHGVYNQLPPHLIDLDDLMGAGYLALVGAAKRLSMASDTVGFLRKRIWGAMVDEVRKAQVVHGGYRQGKRMVMEAIEEGDQRLASVALGPEMICTQEERATKGRKTLQRLLGYLTGKERNILLQNYKGVGGKVIALQYGVKESAIWLRNSQTLTKLRYIAALQEA